MEKKYVLGREYGMPSGEDTIKICLKPLRKMTFKQRPEGGEEAK